MLNDRTSRLSGGSLAPADNDHDTHQCGTEEEAEEQHRGTYVCARPTHHHRNCNGHYRDGQHPDGGGISQPRG